MKTYLMGVWVNEGPMAMWKYNPGDPCTKVHGLFSFDAESVEEALEQLWAVGNREGADKQGRDWPSNVRSLCMGDVVVVAGEGRWTVASIGWQKLADPSARVPT